MIQKNFLLLVLFVVVISIPGCYTVLWSPGEEISDKEYVNYTDEPVIYEPGCWGCYYNPSPWWYPIVSTEEKDNQRKYLDKNLRINGDRNDLPVINRPVNPISLPGPSGPIINVGSAGRPYTPPSNPKPPTTGGGSVKPPATPTKVKDIVDEGDKKPAPVTTERQRDTGSTGQSQSAPAPSDRDRSNSNSNNDNNSPTRSNGGGRR